MKNVNAAAWPYSTLGCQHPSEDATVGCSTANKRRGAREYRLRNEPVLIWGRWFPADNGKKTDQTSRAGGHWTRTWFFASGQHPQIQDEEPPLPPKYPQISIAELVREPYH
eukprot:6464615-Amphidinium_carterae.1